MLTKVRTLIHEEISPLTVLYFPFRARTPLLSFSTLGAITQPVILNAGNNLGFLAPDLAGGDFVWFGSQL